MQGSSSAATPRSGGDYDHINQATHEYKEDVKVGYNLRRKPLAVSGFLFRTVHLFFIKDVQSGLVWLTKILTDPFHDIKLYCKAPLRLLRGELIDPQHAQHRH